ncbi:hypothetical protein CHUAL_011680 [Chamberlinius hualienensis]
MANVICQIKSTRESLHSELEKIKTELEKNKELLQSTNENVFRELKSTRDSLHTYISLFKQINKLQSDVEALQLSLREITTETKQDTLCQN